MSKPRVLITGGCGFIGVNAADRYLSKGWKVSILDNLSRAGTEKNLAWIRTRGAVGFVNADIRDAGAVNRWVSAGKDARLALHLAAQVAVTTSVDEPRRDFEINAQGAFNVLDALRKLPGRPFTIYTSTNKVYGEMSAARVRPASGRYAYADRPHGISEDENLDFHSPYGCSKGAADQYFRDYHRIYGLPTTVFRQSCIYGPHQYGNEDQGWVAHFIKAALAGEGVTLFGDGRQVRDVLYVGDLIDLFERAYARRGDAAGEVYNIGGGPARTLSLLELLDWIASKRGAPLKIRRKGWRPGDQRVYISDVRKARRELGWAPATGVGEGLERLWGWLSREA